MTAPNETLEKVEPWHKLLPCPFCGGAEIIHTSVRDGRAVFCRKCGAECHAYAPDALKKVIQLWNHRQAPQDLVKALEVCRQYTLLITQRKFAEAEEHWAKMREMFLQKEEV